MACVKNTLCFVAALLLIYQKTATCDFLSPLLSPIFENICKEVECGKGNCKASSNSTFMYECVCQNGWKQFDHHLKFLPCIIPNCTFDLTCGEAASPTQPKTPPKDNDTSLFDPCHYVNCGGGSCNKTMSFSYNCDCHQGYENLMNITTLPCLKKCALGTDCLNLGIPPSSSPPSLPESTKNQGAGMNLRGTSLWWMTSLLSTVSIALPWRLIYI